MINTCRQATVKTADNISWLYTSTDVIQKLKQGLSWLTPPYSTEILPVFVSLLWSLSFYNWRLKVLLCLVISAGRRYT